MPWRVCGSITGETCHTSPAKASLPPTGVTCACDPTCRPRRSDSLTCARNSICPPSASRNSTPEPELTTCPGSTLRVSTRPADGARMSRRLVRACASASVARATLTRASAASRVAALRSRSALEMKPRSTSCLARSSSDWAIAASDLATLICAASDAPVCTATERSTSASTWPLATHWPGSTQDACDHPAFARHADRHFAPCGERSGRRDRACDGRAAGHHHRNERQLFDRLVRGRLAAPEDQEARQRQDQHRDDERDDHAATRPLRPEIARQS